MIDEETRIREILRRDQRHDAVENTAAGAGRPRRAVNCKEIKEPFLRFCCELTFENGLTGLNSTLELAKPAI